MWIKGVNYEMNVLRDVYIMIGIYKYYYYFCLDNKDNYDMLIMLIKCFNWNEGKYL